MRTSNIPLFSPRLYLYDNFVKLIHIIRKKVKKILVGYEVFFYWDQEWLSQMTWCCKARIVATQPYTGSESRACASYDIVTTASCLRWAGMWSSSLDTLLAPNTLWTAANLAAPWSDPKYGEKMQPAMHFLLRNLHAPHGGEGPKGT